MNKQQRLFLFILGLIITLIAGFGSWATAEQAQSQWKPSLMVMAIELDSQEDLSCLSFSLSYDSSLIISQENVVINEDRFPWKSRSLVISIDDKKDEIILTAADLIGQNTMVKSGEGLLLNIMATKTIENIEQEPATIKRVSAFNLEGKPVSVELRVL